MKRKLEDRIVTTFKTTREAKDYLAGQIVEEAGREGVPLTEVERKMLCFTETGWTLPDMKAVSTEFDRTYDQDAYERKIGGLAGEVRTRNARSRSDASMWDEAVMKLCDGDHYLLVLVDTAPHQAGSGSSFRDRMRPWLPTASASAQKKPGDGLRLVVVAVVGFMIAGLLVLLSHYLRDRVHF